MSQMCTNVGNLTEAPELRVTPTGQPVVSFTVAVNERYRDNTGAYVDGDAYFLRCTAWGDLAEHIAASINRGARVVVTGRHRSRQYDHKTEKDAEGNPAKRYAHDFLCDEVAASMRWNDVRIVRASRSGAGESPAGTESTDPWAAGPTESFDGARESALHSV